MLSVLFPCCDNKNDPNPGGGVSPDVRKVMAHGLPREIDGCKYVVDPKGRLARIDVDGYYTYFHYGNIPCEGIDGTFDALIMSGEEGYEETYEHMYLRLNDKGYATYAFFADPMVCGVNRKGKYASDYEDYEFSEEYWFEYNSNDQLVKISDEDGVQYALTYDEDGDLISVVFRPGDDISTDCFAYTNAEYPERVENCTGIMYFGTCYPIYIQYIQELYFAAMLGKGSAHLPMGATRHVSSQSSVHEYTYLWEFNDKMMPVRFSVGDGYGFDSNIRW